MLKKILNLSEQLTHARLAEVCAPSGANVYPKVRLADVLPIENSGITDGDYRFALQSHLDFLVVNSESSPQFAVEFDGPSHASTQQKARDEIKDRLCKKFDLPLLRITSTFLTQTYRNMDLLSWFIEVWFMQQDFDQQQETGAIPFDEVFDPLAIIMAEGKDGRFPYWLSAPLLVSFRKLYNEGRCSSPVCYHIIGLDKEDDYQGIGWLQVTDNLVVSATISLKGQNFPILMGDLASELLVYEVHNSVSMYMEGQLDGLTLNELKRQTANFKRRYRLVTSLTSGSLDDY